MQIATQAGRLHAWARRTSCAGPWARRTPRRWPSRRSSSSRAPSRTRSPPKKAEKIFDLMAKFAEYGFNKSHSAAYALIAYQTAYLKAHYPVEFMAALLTSEIGERGQDRAYIGGMPGAEDRGPAAGREREPARTSPSWGTRSASAWPRSRTWAWPPSSRSSRPGRRRGPSRPWSISARKVDLRKVNKRVHREPDQVRGLRQPGSSPAQLLAGLEEAMEWAQELERERANHQITMFGGLPNGGRKAEPRLPDVPEWPENQRLAVGEGDPGLLPDRPSLEQLSPRSCSDSPPWTPSGSRRRPTGRRVIIGGVVNALKEINTKKGDRMAFVTLEDLNGVVEVIVFSELYKNSSLLLKGEDPVFIKGRVDAGEESVKIIASEVLPFEQAVGKLTTSVHLRLRSEGLRREDLEAMREIFQDCRGNCPAFLHLLLPGEKEAVIDLGTNGN